MSTVQVLVPLEGLHVQVRGEIGPITLLPPDEAQQLAAQTPRVGTFIDEDLDRALAGGGALVESGDLQSGGDDRQRGRSAIELVSTGLALLRVFHQAMSVMETPHFGIPGDTWSAHVSFLMMGNQSAAGWIRRGHHRGVHYTAEQRDALNASPGWRFAAEGIGHPRPSDGHRRALMGVELASRAVLETRPDMQLLHAVLAAEAMLLERSRNSQSLLLARRNAFLLCGLERQSRCGRDRPACPLLTIHPNDKAGPTELQRQASLCSEWARVLDWYDLRSDVVHGATNEIDEQDARQATFWVTHRLMPQALKWFASHPEVPIHDLEAAVTALPAPGIERG